MNTGGGRLLTRKRVIVGVMKGLPLIAVLVDLESVRLGRDECGNHVYFPQYFVVCFCFSGNGMAGVRPSRELQRGTYSSLIPVIKTFSYYFCSLKVVPRLSPIGTNFSHTQQYTQAVANDHKHSHLFNNPYKHPYKQGDRKG